MTIEALVRAVPPPASPFFAYSGPWEPVEAEIGTPLPQDYKDFIRFYGSGYFMGFLGIDIPKSWNPNLRLIPNIQETSRIFREFEDLPYPLWPDPGGLICFGGTDNGDHLFWLSTGDPDDWTVVVWDRGMGIFEALDCNLTTFLAGLATGEILPRAFPEDLLPNECLFLPHSARTASWRLGFEAEKDGDGLFSLSWRMGPNIQGRSSISWRR